MSSVGLLSHGQMIFAQFDKIYQPLSYVVILSPALRGVSRTGEGADLKVRMAFDDDFNVLADPKLVYFARPHRQVGA